MTPERKTEIESCVAKLYEARGRLGKIASEQFGEERQPFEPMPLDYEKRHAVALAEVNELEAELRAMIGPRRDIAARLADAKIAA